MRRGVLTLRRMLRTARPLVPAALLASLVVAGLGIGASPAAAAGTCKSKPGQLAKAPNAVLWAKGKSLFVCTAFYGDPPKSARIGPWGKGSTFAFSSGDVLWTVRKPATSTADAEDRIYAADGPFGTWLNGLRLTTGPASALDRRIKTLEISGGAAAWVTTKGTVMAAVAQPQVEPDLIGAGTPGAAAPVVPGVTDVVPPPAASTLLPFPQGLSGAPTKLTGKRFLVGRWTALPNAALAASLSVKYGEGDGDECGGAGNYLITVQPVAGQPAVGVDWITGWTSTSLACS